MSVAGIWSLRVRPRQKLLLLAMAHLRESKQEFSVSSLARFVRADRKTVYRILRELNELGLVKFQASADRAERVPPELAI
jgi:predicted transcriptional regulator